MIIKYIAEFVRRRRDRKLREKLVLTRKDISAHDLETAIHFINGDLDVFSKTLADGHRVERLRIRNPEAYHFFLKNCEAVSTTKRFALSEERRVETPPHRH